MRGAKLLLTASTALVLATITSASPALAKTAQGSGAAAPTAASAAPAVPSTTIRFTATRAAASIAGAVTDADIIICTLNVQNPHNSSHVNGTVNVVAVLTCTSAVPQINIRAALYFNGGLVKDSGQKTVNNSAVAQNNAAVPCRNGTYQGWGSFGVLFPPGFVPPTGTGSGFGNAVNIVC